MASSPQDITKGHIVAIARLEAKPSKGDQLAQIMANLKARADSDLEPGTLRYDIVRYRDSFHVFEVYKDHDAVKKHTEGNTIFEEFLKVKDDVTEPTVPTFWYMDALPEPNVIL